MAGLVARTISCQSRRRPLRPSFTNPRLIGAFAAGVWLSFSRNIIGCLVSGMLAYTAARLWLG